jgi:predicted ATP-grasp superfamily ATP-dependent carboligase
MEQIELPPAAGPVEAWMEFLTGRRSENLRGSVLLACCDAGIEFLLEHRDELASKYRLDISNPVAQRRLLNKLETYQAANEAGVPAPRFWTAETRDHVYAQEHDYVFPLIVKPLFSHKFHQVFGRKFFRVSSFGELTKAYEVAQTNHLDVLLLEEIPGPDDLLCSYYTYIDEDGSAVCDFTKRIIRRFPVGEGLGCYHVTDRNPEVRDLGLRLFGHVGLRGLGNVEFKRDLRDGQLKVIECNARFTAANSLLVASGCDLGLFIYNRLVGLPQHPLPMTYPVGLHLWSPGRDLRAFLALRATGQLSLSEWLAGLAHRQVLPYFRWDDPMPALVGAARFANHATRVSVRRALGGAEKPQPSLDRTVGAP